jgi:LCP family protein required for cell wall assembly
VRRLARVGVVVAALVVLVGGAGIGYVEYRDHQVQRVVVNGLRAVPPSGVENIVLVGSTSRCVLKTQNAAFGLCSQGVTGVNSDVVMILHLDPRRRTAAILSIPRDLFVPNARSSGPNKIDAALAEGPQRLVSTIQEDFGIPIHHYVELNFDSFQDIVNALGGIKMYFPMPLYDAESSLNIPTAGCHELNGFEALAVVRARHLQYKPQGVTTRDRADWPHDPESDLSRIRRDHEFLRVLATAVSARGLDNPLTDNDLLSAVAPQLEVDSSFSLGDMLGTILTFHGVNPNTAPQQTLPVIVDADDYLFDGSSYGDVELTSEPQDSQVVDSFLGVGAGRDTMTGKPLPTPGSFTVSVLNGTGVTGQAGATKAALAAFGFDVTATGDSPAAGAVSETTVYYSAGHEAAAERVARALTGSVAMGLGPTDGGTAVTVVTGTDFSVNAPPTPSGGTGAGTTATTVPQASPVPPGTLAPPTAPTQALAPFDPRSCTASGSEGT